MVSAAWSGPDHGVLRWLDTGDGGVFALDVQYPRVRDAVVAGDVYWVTLVVQDNAFEFPDYTFAEELGWDYPNDHTAILIPTQTDVEEWVGIDFFPTMIWLDEDLRLTADLEDDPYAHLADLEASLR